jgi:hypothetical protein
MLGLSILYNEERDINGSVKIFQINVAEEV